jgi:uncharacterized integral membrane protein
VWVVRVVLTVALLSAIVLFIAVNLSTRVSVDLVYEKYADSPLVTVLVIAFLLGLIVGLVIAAERYLAARSGVRQLGREVRMLEEELAALRNLPFTDLDSEGDRPAPDADEEPIR